MQTCSNPIQYKLTKLTRMIPATIALEPATLYLVATPLGNLRDISIRALDILHSVDFIFAEDTRHSNQLLQHYNLGKSCTASLHEFNEQQQVPRIMRLLQNRKTVALISDAGTPLIADPGFRLVQAIHQANQQTNQQTNQQAVIENTAKDTVTTDKAKDHTQIHRPTIKVCPVPGACALIAALSCAGLPTDNFLFVGFLPVKRGSCQNKLRILATETCSLICYEAPHRLLTTLEDIAQILGDRQVCIARELTKIHETITTQSIYVHLAQFRQQVARQQPIRGEYVLIIAGCPEKSRNKISAIHPEQEKMLHILHQHCGSKKAAEIMHAMTGIHKKAWYQHSLQQVRQP